MNIIKIIEYTGNNIAVSASEGKIVFEKITSLFNEEKSVILDFKDIKLTISAFLNPCIGQLYSIYPQSKIKDLLKVINMSQDDVRILNIVVESAKERFKNFPNIDSQDLDILSNEE